MRKGKEILIETGGEKAIRDRRKNDSLYDVKDGEKRNPTEKNFCLIWHTAQN